MATLTGVVSPTFLIINITEDRCGAQTTNCAKLIAHTPREPALGLARCQTSPARRHVSPWPNAADLLTWLLLGWSRRACACLTTGPRRFHIPWQSPLAR